MPSFIPPMLPTLVDEPPTGDQWLHEIKHDGYRTQLHLKPSDSRAFTRNGHDWSHLYRFVLQDAERFASDAILDGEIIIQDEEGRSDFDNLKSAIANQPERLIFYAFDLLWLDGSDLRRESLIDRRQRMREMIGDPGADCRVQFSDHTIGGGPEFFEGACTLNLEGIVSKRVNSRYASGRTRDWLKIKAFAEGEFVLLGWQRSTRAPPCALLARETADGLEYAGSAFITLSDADRERFWRAMDRLATSSPALELEMRSAVSWVRPELKVGAKYLRCSPKLRHATLCGLLS